MRNKKDTAFARKVFNELCKVKFGKTVTARLGGSFSKEYDKVSRILSVSDKDKRLSSIKYFAEVFEVPESFVAQIFKYEGAEEIKWEN